MIAPPAASVSTWSVTSRTTGAPARSMMSPRLSQPTIDDGAPCTYNSLPSWAVGSAYGPRLLGPRYGPHTGASHALKPKKNVLPVSATLAGPMRQLIVCTFAAVTVVDWTKKRHQPLPQGITRKTTPVMFVRTGTPNCHVTVTEIRFTPAVWSRNSMRLSGAVLALANHEMVLIPSPVNGMRAVGSCLPSMLAASSSPIS